MEESYAHLKTNELAELADALWDSPEHLHSIRHVLLHRRTMGADSLRILVEARLAEFDGGRPRAATSVGSESETLSDVLALKKQISSLTAENIELRKLAGLRSANAYLYARVGAMSRSMTLACRLCVRQTGTGTFATRRLMIRWGRQK